MRDQALSPTDGPVRSTSPSWCLTDSFNCNQLLSHLDPRDDLLQCLGTTHKLELLKKDHSTKEVK